MDQEKNTQPQLIALDRLRVSPQNVRRTASKVGLEELRASILAHGLMQNLVVTAAEDGTFDVIAGGRRLEALRSLWDEGKLPGDYAVPCQVVGEGRARELSLAENKVRLAMHPADEFEVFVELIESGHTASQVAERFGVDEKHVLQRLKLGRVAPDLIAEYREGKLNLECLMAFTMSDDRERQLSVYRSLKGWQRDEPSHIRRLLTETMTNGDSKLATFVGLDAYRAAGGVVRSDLFGEDVYLENPDLLNQLATEKLEGLRRDLESRGWGWVEVAESYDYSFVNRCSRIRSTPTEVPPELLAEKEAAEAEFLRLDEELEGYEDRDPEEENEETVDESDLYERHDAARERVDAIEERLGEYVTFDPEEMKSAGCYMCLEHDGKLRIERGLVKRKDEKQLHKGKAGTKGSAKTKQTDQLSASLRSDLEVYRLNAAQVELANHPTIAFDLLAFNLAMQVLKNKQCADGPTVRLEPSDITPSVEDKAAKKRLKAIEDGLPREWMKAKSEGECFTAFCGLSVEEKLRLLAYCTARSLQPKLAEGGKPSAYGLSLTKTGANVAEYWRPTKDNYLSRISRDQLASIGVEVFGKSWANDRAKHKKGQLVTALDLAFGDPEGQGETPEQVEKLRNWLPQGMAFVTPEKKPGKSKSTAEPLNEVDAAEYEASHLDREIESDGLEREAAV